MPKRMKWGGEDGGSIDVYSMPDGAIRVVMVGGGLHHATWTEMPRCSAEELILDLQKGLAGDASLSRECEEVLR